ncbi:hypothetical protein FIM02_01865 [SAR202 cluster bacterium AD-802-E10_MRT_200m]|nr:hypothetical protein [SAR202 cluster bacterium AD-802-E10_MRT_200m]
MEIEIHVNDEAVALLLALTRAFNDTSRSQLIVEGIEERDLAFEAGLLEPFEVELTIYSTRKRNRILTNLKVLQDQGWAELRTMPSTGAYHVFLTLAGQEFLLQLVTPSWKKNLGKIRSKWKGLLRNLIR